MQASKRENKMTRLYHSLLDPRTEPMNIVQVINMYKSETRESILRGLIHYAVSLILAGESAEVIEQGSLALELFITRVLNLREHYQGLSRQSLIFFSVELDLYEKIRAKNEQKIRKFLEEEWNLLQVTHGDRWRESNEISLLIDATVNTGEYQLLEGNAVYSAIPLVFGHLNTMCHGRVTRRLEGEFWHRFRATDAWRTAYRKTLVDNEQARNNMIKDRASVIAMCGTALNEQVSLPRVRKAAIMLLALHAKFEHWVICGD